MYLRSTAVKVALLCIAVCQSAWSAELKIVGPDAIPVGTTAFLKLEGVKQGEPFDYFVTPTSGSLVVLFDIGGSPVGVLNGDKPGAYTIVAVAYDAESKKISRRLHSITVGTPIVVVPPAPVDPTVPPVVQPAPSDKATQVTFVYEKDSHEVPKAVLSALNKINRERKILATILEADTVDGSGQVPEQYKVALAAAKKTGLPCLVVQSGDVVLSVVKSPKTDVQVLEAVK